MNKWFFHEPINILEKKVIALIDFSEDNRRLLSPFFLKLKESYFGMLHNCTSQVVLKKVSFSGF